MEKFFYRVKRGDTAIGVAEKFSVSVFGLIKDNALVGEIRAGDILVVRRPEKLYAVKPFDSARRVAEKFGIGESELLMANGGVPYVFYGLKIKTEV